jgi:hypothetical protein
MPAPQHLPPQLLLGLGRVLVVVVVGSVIVQMVVLLVALQVSVELTKQAPAQPLLERRVMVVCQRNQHWASYHHQ